MKTKRTPAIRAMAALLLGAATILPVAGVARADTSNEVLGPNILPNGGFERGAAPGVHLAIAAGSPLLTNWTAVGGEVAVYGTYWQAQEGTRSLALAHAGTAITTVSGVKQIFPTIAGQRYRVIFYQAGNPNDHQPSVLRFQIADQSRDFTFQEPATATAQKMVWVKRSFVFTASAASTTISFLAFYTPGNDPLGLDNVQVRAIQAAPGSSGSAAKTTTLQLGAATVAAGGSETIGVTAAPNAPVALVIDSPDGTQVVTPGHADASGHYSYTWAVPSGAHGTVHVVADSAGSVAQATFTVS
jgi:choice-of-anchor C domain-containing protein